MPAWWSPAAALQPTHPRLPLPPAPAVQVTRHPRCRVRVTISERPGAVAQDGHKVSLSAVMLSHWAIRLNKYDEQVEKMNQVLH